MLSVVTSGWANGQRTEPFYRINVIQTISSWLSIVVEFFEIFVFFWERCAVQHKFEFIACYAQS